MNLANIVLVVLALGVSVWLGRGTGRWAQALVVLSALGISALLFLPTGWLQVVAGSGLMATLEASAARWSWELSDAVHLLVFTWLALLLRLLRRDLHGWRGPMVLLVLAIAAELTQGLTSAREARLADVAINLLGAGAGLLLAESLLAVRRRWDGRRSGSGQ